VEAHQRKEAKKFYRAQDKQLNREFRATVGTFAPRWPFVKIATLPVPSVSGMRPAQARIMSISCSGRPWS